MSVAMTLAFRTDVNAPLVTHRPVTLMMQGDDRANVIELTMVDGDAPLNLDGYSAVLYLGRKDGVKVRCPGTVAGNVAKVTLQAECYSVPGPYAAVMKLTGPEEKRTVLRLAGYVESDGEGPIIDPSGTIPSYDDLERIMKELEDALQQAETAISGANAAAQNANEKAAIADTAAGNANTAAGNANAGAGRANEASESIEGLTVEASDVAYNKPATATVTDVEGHKHIAFGLRQGVPGPVPKLTFTGETGEPNTDVVITQSGPPEAPVVNLKIPQGVPGTGNVSSVDGVVSDTGGNVSLSSVRYVMQMLQPAQQQQARANIGAQASIIQNYTYDGHDLSQMFTAAELHQKVSSGDFSGIQNGDYWPIILTGSFKDYAVNQTKTLNNAIIKLEANLDVYYWYGENNIPHHILFCSRDLIPVTLAMRSDAATWYDDSQTNPWLGSALYQTLNASDGLQALVASTDIGAYMYAGFNGNGMRFRLETKAPGATTAYSWAWDDRGKLFLPTERELWGQDIWSEHIWGSGAAVQWPLFIGCTRHIRKGLGDSRAPVGWWCQSSVSNSTTGFAISSTQQLPNFVDAQSDWLGTPLCFLFV